MEVGMKEEKLEAFEEIVLPDLRLETSTEEMRARKQSHSKKISNRTPPVTEKLTKLRQKRRRKKNEMNARAHPNENPGRADCDEDPENPALMSELHVYKHNTSVLLASCNATPFKGKNNRGFRCFYCTRRFKEPELLREHTRTDHCHDRLSHAVPRCDPGDHALYLDIAALACRLCSQAAPDLNALRSHLITSHDKTLFTHHGDRDIPFLLSQGTLACQRCSQTFETFGALERHMNTHYRNFTCGACGSGYITAKRLRTHASFAHSAGSFPCGDCGKVFASAVKAKKHPESVHRLKYRYKCPQCPEKFFKYFQRQSHLVKMHNAAPLEYKCSLCNRIFEMKDSLNKHTRKHHLLERNHRCGQCSYTCFTSTGLRNHMVSHTGERTYKCEVCKKSYGRKNTLQQHMRIHNDDRRFACAVCGQSFVQNCSLKSHVRVHHAEANTREAPLSEMTVGWR